MHNPFSLLIAALAILNIVIGLYRRRLGFFGSVERDGQPIWYWVQIVTWAIVAGAFVHLYFFGYVT